MTSDGSLIVKMGHRLERVDSDKCVSSMRVESVDSISSFQTRKYCSK